MSPIRPVRLSPIVVRYGCTKITPTAIAASTAAPAGHHRRPSAPARPITTATPTPSAHAARPQSAAPAASTVPRRMRVAVISDIHGNLHALEAVLQDVDEQRVDVTWCLGDLVGYGPRPNRCCALAAERAAICLAGNH